MLYVPLFFYLFDRLAEGKGGGEDKDKAAPTARAVAPAPPAVTPPAHGD